jgi:colanic acid biosynthesis glycosyl transferase WcaI
MRLLIFSIRFAPEVTGSADVVTGLARALAARGHQVTVLAGTPHHRLPRVPPGYLFRPFRRELYEGVKIVRCWALPRSYGKIAELLNYLAFTLTSFLASLFTGRPGAVLVVSPPFWLGFSALFLKALWRCPVIYNAQDLFPDAYLASGEVRAGWLTRAMTWLMTHIYQRCDRITVITNSFAENIAAQGIDPRKIQNIPNFIDTSAITPLPRCNSFSRRWQLDDRFVVMYAGNIGYTHGTEMLVEAAQKLASIADLLFLVIGEGSKQAGLARLARERQVANLRFLPTQPGETLPEMLASADVFVLTTKPGVGKTSFPSRVYSFLLAARPVVASVDADSDTARLLREASAGLVTAPGDVEDFCRAIVTLYHDASARECLGRGGAEFMARHYCPDAVVDQYDKLLREMDALAMENRVPA